MLAWIDVETTGLRATQGVLLELAIVITTDDLTEVASYTSPIYQDRRVVLDLMEDNVLDMHTESGLLGAMQQAPPLWKIEENACYLLDLYAEKPPLAGSTINFDREWLRTWTPDLFTKLHYRNIDVSTLKELNKRWQFASEWVKAETHRALPDIQESIAELRHYRSALVG